MEALPSLLVFAIEMIFFNLSTATSIASALFSGFMIGRKSQQPATKADKIESKRELEELVTEKQRLAGASEVQIRANRRRQSGSVRQIFGDLPIDLAAIVPTDDDDDDDDVEAAGESVSGGTAATISGSRVVPMNIIPSPVDGDFSDLAVDNVLAGDGVEEEEFSDTEVLTTKGDAAEEVMRVTHDL